MTQDQLEILATEYAKRQYAQMMRDDYTDDDPAREDLLAFFRCDFYDVVQFLSERYEIVSKEKVKKERETAEWTDNQGGLHVLKRLFPETLKPSEQ